MKTYKEDKSKHLLIEVKNGPRKATYYCTKSNKYYRELWLISASYIWWSGVISIVLGFLAGTIIGSSFVGGSLALFFFATAIILSTSSLIEVKTNE